MSKRKVVARVCVEGTVVLMRIVEQRGIERGCGEVPVEGAPLAVASHGAPQLRGHALFLRGDCALEDDDMDMFDFTSQADAREYADMLAKTIAAINGDRARVPCNRCGRPGVLVEYPADPNSWIVMCRDMCCDSIGVDGPTPEGAWAQWDKENRGAIDFPEGTFVTIGGDSNEQ